MKIKYRIKKSHLGDTPEFFQEPSFEGSSKKECDEKAKKFLEELGGNEFYSYDTFFLSRIDVEEVTTPIFKNRPKTNLYKGPRETILHA